MPRIAQMTEKELIEGCLSNDRFAQRELYDRYKTAMFTLAYRIVGDFSMAEEILQDGFLKVFRGLTGFRGDSTIGAWIKIIIIRTAYSKVRKKVNFDPLDQAHFDRPVEFPTSLDTEYLEKAILGFF